MYNVPRQGPPHVQQPPMQAPPGSSHSVAAGPPAGMYMPTPPKRYAALRFVAGTCVVSAWGTLVLSIIGGLMMMAGGGLTAAAGGMAGSSLGGGSYGSPEIGGMGGMGGGNPGADMGKQLLTTVLPALQMVSGLFTIATGVGAFLVLLAMGLIIYVLLDMEENTRSAAQAMNAIARRMGMPGA